MFAASEVLRLSFEKGMSELYRKKENIIHARKSAVKKSSRKKSSLKSSQYMRCPAEVNALISKMYPSGKVSSRGYSSAKKLIESSANVKVDSLVANFCKKNNIARCNTWYVVAQYPELMEVLVKAVSDARRA